MKSINFSKSFKPQRKCIPINVQLSPDRIYVIPLPSSTEDDYPILRITSNIANGIHVSKILKVISKPSPIDIDVPGILEVPVLTIV